MHTTIVRTLLPTLTIILLLLLTATIAHANDDEGAGDGDNSPPITAPPDDPFFWDVGRDTRHQRR